MTQQDQGPEQIEPIASVLSWKQQLALAERAEESRLKSLYQAAKDENELLEFKNYELLFKIQELEQNQNRILSKLMSGCNEGEAPTEKHLNPYDHERKRPDGGGRDGQLCNRHDGQAYNTVSEHTFQDAGGTNGNSKSLSSQQTLATLSHLERLRLP